MSDERKADQAALDKAVGAAIGGAGANMELYLKSKFSLSNGETPPDPALHAAVGWPSPPPPPPPADR